MIGLAPESLTSLRGRSVLIVEDNIDTQAFLARMLGFFGCEVTLATNGAEGIARASQRQFDVILMDFCMPELDGISATQELRTRGYKGPIIGVTAAVEMLQGNDPEDLGFTDCLLKPVNRIQLASRIGQLI